ncbi:TIGR03663 family protein [Bacteriovoracaceae bacterium]|nr:TIGR03663 family protein [Bacteriovoracaceae bacterium]
MISDHHKKYSVLQWLALFSLIVAGIFFRFYHLDVRAFHHDESLHGYYSYLFFKDSASHFYKYNPLLHGPLLYNTLPFFYWIFGITKFVSRMPVALISSLLLIIPLYFKDKIKYSTMFLIISLLAFSPSLLYWSRFIRHDFFVLLGLSIILVGYFIQPPFWKAPLIGLGAAIHFCTKENFFVHLALLIGFVIFESILNYFSTDYRETLIHKTLSYIKHNFLPFLIGVVLFSLISTYFYTFGFQYWDGIIDGLYRKSLTYWFHQHQVERISGPFSYLSIILSLYDPWIIFFLSIHLILFYRSMEWLPRLGFFLTFLLSFLFYFMFEKQMFLYPFFKDILKIKTPIDFWLYFPLIYHAVTVTAHYLRSEQKTLAVSGYLFFSSLFTYSYLGEKVPWLAVYPLIAGIIFLSFHLSKELSFHWSIFFVPILFLNIHRSYVINFQDVNENRHAISQVQTTKDYETKALSIIKEIENAPEEALPRVLAYGTNVWPLAYYFRDNITFDYNQSEKNFERYDYIFLDHRHLKLVKDMSQFDMKVLPMRHWWTPDQRSITWSGYFNTLVFLKPWSNPGVKNSYLLKKKTY